MLASSSQAARDLPFLRPGFGLDKIFNELWAEKNPIPRAHFRLPLPAGGEPVARLRQTRAVIHRPSTRREGTRRSSHRGGAVGNRARTTPRFQRPAPARPPVRRGVPEEVPRRARG